MESEPSLEKKDGSNWLKDLARQSWKSELLLSGFCIFSVLNFPCAFLYFQDVAEYNLSSDMLDIMAMLKSYIWLGWIVLLFNFIFHFVLRASWVGVVGLSSVFPDGIKYDSLPNYSERGKEEVRKRLPSLRNYASTSTEFAASFSSFLLPLFSPISR